MNEYRFNLGDVEIEVHSELPEVLDDLAALYRGDAGGARGAAPAITMEVKHAGRLPLRRYRVLGDGEAFGEDVRRREVLPYLEWAVNWRFMARCADRMLVHAASMVRDGKGVIFAGPSGAGKSTLVAGLLAHGWQYLCDEFAMIDTETLRLMPFPKAVCVKAGAFDLVRRLGLRLCGDRRYVKALKGEVGYISPSDLGEAPGPAAITHVVFPRYTGHATSRLRDTSAARAGFGLVSNTLNRETLGSRANSTASRLVRDARCAMLDTGDLEHACNLIESFVST